MYGEVRWYIKSTQKWSYWFIYDVFLYVPQLYVDVLLFSIIDKEVLSLCSCQPLSLVQVLKPERGNIFLLKNSIHWHTHFSCKEIRTVKQHLEENRYQRLNTWTFQIKRKLCEFAFLTSIYIMFQKFYSNRYSYDLILDNYYILLNLEQWMYSVWHITDSVLHLGWCIYFCSCWKLLYKSWQY